MNYLSTKFNIIIIDGAILLKRMGYHSPDSITTNAIGLL